MRRLYNLRLFLIITLLILLSGDVKAADTEKLFRIFETEQGEEINLERLISDIKNSDVIFIGEEHNDKIAHFLEFEILKGLYQKNKNTSLALEFFERDVQLIIDEYVQGLITEEHFLASARPPANYKEAYRPLIEYARQNRLDVVAANAPRRYVNMVTRLGVKSLSRLSPRAKKYLAPLPYALPGGRYLEKLEENAERIEETFAKMQELKEVDNSIIKMRNVLEMQETQEGDLRFANQGLWDATMAYSLAQRFKEKGGPILMINGSFHSDEGLGIVTQLERYLPRVKRNIITIKPVSNLNSAAAKQFFKCGDFVILTNNNAQVVRTQEHKEEGK